MPKSSKSQRVSRLAASIVGSAIALIAAGGGFAAWVGCFVPPSENQSPTEILWELPFESGQYEREFALLGNGQLQQYSVTQGSGMHAVQTCVIDQNGVATKIGASGESAIVKSRAARIQVRNPLGLKNVVSGVYRVDSP